MTTDRAPAPSKLVVGLLVPIAAVAVLTALYVGRDLFVPLFLGLVIVSLLAPVVERLRRWHIPAPVGSAVAVLATVAIVVVVGFAIEPPIQGLILEIPKSMSAAQARLQQYRAPLARIGIHLESPARSATRRQRPKASPTPAPASTSTSPRAAADTAKSSAPAAAPGDSAKQDTSGADTSKAQRDRKPPLPVAQPQLHAQPPSAPGAPPSGGTAATSAAPAGLLSTAGRVFGVTSQVLTEFVEELLIAFFVLAAGASWHDKLSRAVQSEEHRERTISAVREMRRVVARYILVTAAINVAQGIAVALVMWWLGLASPLLWGALTFLAEWVPYLGGFLMVVLLLIASLASGASVLHAMLAPITYLAISTLQNNLVSPAAYGRGLRLNPTVILLTVVLWYAMWGVAGAFLAVPILAALRIVSTHVPALEPVAVFLED